MPSQLGSLRCAIAAWQRYGVPPQLGSLTAYHRSSAASRRAIAAGVPSQLSMPSQPDSLAAFHRSLGSPTACHCSSAASQGSLQLSSSPTSRHCSSACHCSSAHHHSLAASGWAITARQPHGEPLQLGRLMACHRSLACHCSSLVSWRAVVARRPHSVPSGSAASLRAIASQPSHGMPLLLSAPSQLGSCMACRRSRAASRRAIAAWQYYNMPSQLGSLTACSHSLAASQRATAARQPHDEPTQLGALSRLRVHRSSSA
jgi:hypothetical protein